jgi:hypothetical protein
LNYVFTHLFASLVPNQNRHDVDVQRIIDVQQFDSNITIDEHEENTIVDYSMPSGELFEILLSTHFSSYFLFNDS